MYLTSSFFLAALASVAHAQFTPQNFKPSANAKLDVVFGSTTVGTPGQLLSKATTAIRPQIALSNAQSSASDTYMFVMLDLDVPPANGTTKRRVILHAMETGFKATQQRVNGSATVLASTQQGPAMYLPPGPPATDTMAHRYVQLLFQQPAVLKAKAADFANSTGRINFDITKFMADNGVGAPVAANFFTVDGRANATAGNGAPTQTGSGGRARSSTVPFEGGVGRIEASVGFMGVLGTVVALMG